MELKLDSIVNARANPKEHLCWRNMILRCTKPNHKSYAQYGGRGISVCADWIKCFAAFFAHVGKAPTHSHTLDRIDVNGDYEPGNVRWATFEEQCRNKRSNVYVGAGEIPVKILGDAAKAIGISGAALRGRLNRGWRVEDALTIGKYKNLKTHCIRGHELSGDNVRVRAIDGSRVCLACATAQRRARAEIENARQRELRKLRSKPPKSARTHCTNGHLMSDENVRRNPSGSPICRPCAAERLRLYRSKIPKKEKTVKTHCKKGHAFSGSNLGFVKSPGGVVYRRCRACDRLSHAKSYVTARARDEATLPTAEAFARRAVQ